MTPPLTRKATGSTICPGCGKRFASAPGATVETECAEPNEGRVDSIGQKHRGIGTHKVMRRWHAVCLSDLEAMNQAYREQVKADNEALCRLIAEDAGLDFDEIKRQMEER